MTSRELNYMLIQWIPEIAEAYEKEIEWQEGDETGSHIIFGDVLVPYIIKLVEDQEGEALKKFLILLRTFFPWMTSMQKRLLR